MEKYTEIIKENGHFTTVVIENGKFVELTGYDDENYFDCYAIRREFELKFKIQHAAVHYGTVRPLGNGWYVASGYIYLKEGQDELVRSSKYKYEKEALKWRRENPLIAEEEDLLVGAGAIYEEDIELSEEDYFAPYFKEEEELPF